MEAVLIVIFFFLTPILIMGVLEVTKDRRKRVVKRILEQALSRLTEENALLIVDVEFFSNKVIGVDRRNKKAVYAHYRKETVDQFCIDLNLVSFCRVNKIIDNSTNEVKNIFLEVKCRGINKIFRLNFYDSSFNNMRDQAFLLRKAEQWKTKINLNRRSVSFQNQCEYVS